MKNTRPSTIKDIANQLKLSPSTVSRALRGSPEINPKTRKLVMEVARQLNYSPNPIALSLKECHSRIIGVIVPEIANNFCSATIAGIEDICYNRGYHVVIFQSHEKYQREVTDTQLLASRRTDGLLITLSNETTCYEHLNSLIEGGIPVVMFDRVCKEINTHKVVVDDYEGALCATEHLIEQGYTRIAHLSTSPVLSITQQRLRGYSDALKRHHIPVRKEWIVHCDFETCEIENAVRSLFSAGDRPNAIFASVERLAIGCLKVFKDMHLKIPDEVALVAFSDNPLNAFLDPPLTAVRQPTFEIGQKSAELLIELIESKENVKQFKTIELKTRLDIRRSSCRRR
jgi:LacI family transcriptional regulator